MKDGFVGNVNFPDFIKGQSLLQYFAFLGPKLSMVFVSPPSFYTCTRQFIICKSYFVIKY